MKNLTSKDLENIFDDIVSPFSFEKKGLTYFKKAKHFIQIIEIQKYSFKIENNIAFTINVGIIAPQIFQKSFGQNHTFSSAEGIIHFNIGELISNFDGRIINKYWLLSNQALLSSELKEIIKVDILPFLNSIENNNDAIKYISKNNILSKSIGGTKTQIDALLRDHI